MSLKLEGSVGEMEGSFAEELYSESLRLSKVELGAPQNSDGEVVQYDDGNLWDDSDEEFNKTSELDREWKRRRDQFHTVGYRDGLMAGKEASAQEGFNMGFKESVLVGHKWGLVRGVSSALVCLPDGLKESSMGTKENRERFRVLSESMHSLSTTDALQLFHEDIITKSTVGQNQNAEVGTDAVGLQEGSGSNKLESYFEELQSLLLGSPKIEARLTLEP